MNKVAFSALLGAVLCVGVVSVAMVQIESSRQKTARDAADLELEALKDELSEVKRRLAQAERRAAEAENDATDLLNALQSLKAPPASTIASASQRAQNPIAAMLPAAPVRTAEEEERLTQQRVYQQQLAKRRVEEAKARARVDEDAAKQNDGVARYHRLIDAAERLAANAEFQAAIRMCNQAMEAKPADLPVSDRIRQMQTVLAEQNRPVDVALMSDGLTWVSIVNTRAPEKFTSVSAKILPGNYHVVGRRAGFQDVVIPLEIRNGTPAPVLSVICSVPKE